MQIILSFYLRHSFHTAKYETLILTRFLRGLITSYPSRATSLIPHVVNQVCHLTIDCEMLSRPKTDVLREGSGTHVACGVPGLTRALRTDSEAFVRTRSWVACVLCLTNSSRATHARWGPRPVRPQRPPWWTSHRSSPSCSPRSHTMALLLACLPGLRWACSSGGCRRPSASCMVACFLVRGRHAWTLMRTRTVHAETEEPSDRHVFLLMDVQATGVCEHATSLSVLQGGPCARTEASRSTHLHQPGDKQLHRFSRACADSVGQALSAQRPCFYVIGHRTSPVWSALLYRAAHKSRPVPSVLDLRRYSWVGAQRALCA